MGSGENWVSYHVAVHLSLHKLFRRPERPVPGFLMLDQPSQAHYPPERDNEGKLDDLTDEDQAAVHRLFELLHTYATELHPGMQIIVADHVELLDSWFRLHGDQLVANFRKEPHQARESRTIDRPTNGDRLMLSRVGAGQRPGVFQGYTLICVPISTTRSVGIWK